MLAAPQTVVETPIYLALAERLMNDDERSAVVDLVATTPDAGKIMTGTGGVRKLRVPLAGRGKRGGARVIYYVHDAQRPIYLLLAYGKNEQDDLSADQKMSLRRIAESIKRGEP